METFNHFLLIETTEKALILASGYRIHDNYTENKANLTF